MILTDSNVLIHAFRRDADRHQDYADWLEARLGEETAFGYSDQVLASFLRIVTHPRIFARPSSTKEAFEFTEFLRSQPNAVHVAPQSNHWSIFHRLCVDAGAKGNLIPDAWLAALAIESGSRWYTADRDFARFPGLKWKHPLDP